VKYLLTGQVAPGDDRVGLGRCRLMTVMVLHRPLYRLIIKREHPVRIVKQSGFVTELLESIVELFDDLIRFVANTVSFIRVAAFALSHAALFTAVFSIANIVSHEKGGGISYWLVVVVGNIIIILLRAGAHPDGPPGYCNSLASSFEAGKVQTLWK
jgi:V/A-type H+-transporting ATPase subunit I